MVLVEKGNKFGEKYFIKIREIYFRLQKRKRQKRGIIGQVMGYGKKWGIIGQVKEYGQKGKVLGASNGVWAEKRGLIGQKNGVWGKKNFGNSWKKRNFANSNQSSLHECRIQDHNVIF